MRVKLVGLNEEMLEAVKGLGEHELIFSFIMRREVRMKI